jgi:hypothetical protein
VRLEGLSKLKKSTSSGSRTGDLPATLPHAPNMRELRAFKISGILPILNSKYFVLIPVKI